MRFPDYKSLYDVIQRGLKGGSYREAGIDGFDLTPGDYGFVYRGALKCAETSNDPHMAKIVATELMWYECRRPYFNVYPMVEKKLLELNDNIDLKEVSLPFEAIEVRTLKYSSLLVDTGASFYFGSQARGIDNVAAYQVSKTGTIGSMASKPLTRMTAPSWARQPSADDTSDDHQKSFRELLFIAAGVCLLAKDRTVVAPVLLNKHRRDNMTPDEIAAYAEKAIKRTGRVGFDVGRDIERLKAGAHYRNGCFAKYYVGKDHPSYPVGRDDRLVPIIQWRMGAIVNEDNLPKVPTGFKDAGVTA